MAEQQSGPLAGFRILDLATERAELAGRVLADLGAEVIVIEPPGGSSSRRTPPFDERAEAAGESLYWAAVGIGKQSVVLDLEDTDDRATLVKLAETADALVESFDPGYMASLGLGFDDLAAVNPTLIYTSVTPYGQSGPDAATASSDLTLQAAGGLISLQGDPDRPPVPVGYPQAAFHAGVQAAADTVIALYERALSGRGQHLDVSMQIAIVWTLMNATGYPPNEHTDPPTAGDNRNSLPAELLPGVLRPPALWQGEERPFTCAAGLGEMGARTVHLLARWAEEEGALPDDLVGIDLLNWTVDVAEGRLTPERLAATYDALYAFVATKSSAELMTRATRDSLLLAPILTVEGVAGDPQLEARGYWEEIAGRRHPGKFAKGSKNPVNLGREAPNVGEHQAVATAASRKRHRVGSTPSTRSGVFEGLKIADFAWVGAGPLVTRALADHGATVVHLETLSRPDVLRTAPPFKDSEPGLDNAQFMANFNSSKLGIAADLTTEEGRAVAKRLIDWADVVMESFTPGVMARFGFDYETLSKERPDLVMMSSCLRGQTGPENVYAGFGGQGAALAGIHGVTGWPDRDAYGPWGAYTDFISPRYSVAVLASALLHRQATGEGQYIDFSQVEASIHFIEPLILDYTVNGRIAEPAGMTSATASPNGVFHTQGIERYVAISVQTAAQWDSLTGHISGLSPFSGATFGDIDARRAESEAIDAVLTSWCAGQEPFALVEGLKSIAVPAAVVQRPSDLYNDRQLQHRDFFVTLEHTSMGPTPYDGVVTLFSKTPAKLRKAAPMLGEDTHKVLTELLGYGDEEVGVLAAAGALS